MTQTIRKRLMDRALFYAVIVGGTSSLCTLILLNNAPIALVAGALLGFMALLRGMAVWG